MSVVTVKTFPLRVSTENGRERAGDTSGQTTNAHALAKEYPSLPREISVLPNEKHMK